MFKRIYPYLIFIFFTYIIWWSPHFWQPDTYLNIGDSLFPFRPIEQTTSFFYTWKDNANEGLGQNETYLSTITLYYYALMALLKIIGVPLWICNRLFFLIPTLALFFSAYYMISAFIDAKYRRIGAVLGSLFLTTAPPLTFLDPKLHLGISGMILSFGALKKILDKQRNRHLVTFAIGFLLMTSMPRYIYIGSIFMGFYLVCWYILDSENRVKYNLFEIFRIASIGLMLVLLLNCYTFLPTISFLFKQHSSGLMPGEDIFFERVNTVDHFRNTTSLFYTGRLINSRMGSYKYSSGYFNLLMSFLFIIFLFIPLIINKRIGKENFYILITSFFLLLWTFVFGSSFYKFLMRVIPGFWIINNPMYILIPLALLYSILLSYSTTGLLGAIRGRKKVLSAIIIAGVTVLIIINNGVYFSDRIPHVKKMFVKWEIMTNGLGNHLPYFKIPEEYEMLRSSLPDEDRAARILVLPFLYGNMKYSWWYFGAMPEILVQITNLRTGGDSGSPSDRLYRIRDLILSGSCKKVINILRSLRYKYIFIHKDNIYPQDFEPKDFIAQLSTVDELELILDNRYFRLYKLKPLHYNMQKQLLLLDEGEDGQNIEDIILHRANRPTTKLYYISDKDGEFYVHRADDYLIEARISSHLRFVRKRDKHGAGFRFRDEDLRNWAISPSNVSFDYYTTEDGMLVLSSYFDGEKKEDEFVQMQTNNISVDLKKYPYFDLVYKIENPDVQTIEVVAGVDFDNDGKVNEYVSRLYPRSASTGWDDFRCDLFLEVKSRFLDKENYNLIFLELYPHKLWEVDCSASDRKGKYTFWIKGISFYSLTTEEFILNKDGDTFSPTGFAFHEPIFNLDGERFWLSKRFKDKEDALQDMWFRQKIHLSKGKHYLTKLEVNGFKVEWVIVEPLHTKKEPKIVFNRINPTRYEVEVKGASEPFWLLFEEGFHDKWKLFFKKDIVNAEHAVVNGYANGWYIDPEKMNLPEDFTLSLYFQPQRLYNLGLGVSVLTLISLVGFFWRCIR